MKAKELAKLLMTHPDWDTALFGELVLMVDVFAACIETGRMPTHGSPCHRKARQLVDKSGMKPKRKRRRLPPNAESEVSE